MNDVVVQFARLWGQREAWWASGVEEEDIQKELNIFRAEVPYFYKWGRNARLSSTKIETFIA